MSLAATGKSPCSRFRRNMMGLVEHSGRRSIDEVSLRRGMFSYAGAPISTEFLEHLKPKHARKSEFDFDDDYERARQPPPINISSRPSETEKQPTAAFWHPLGLKTDNALKRTCFEGKSGLLTGDDFQPGVNAKIKLAEQMIRDRVAHRLQEQRNERLRQGSMASNSTFSLPGLASPPEDHPWPGPSTPGRTHVSGYQGTLLARTGIVNNPIPPGSAKTINSSAPSDGGLPPSRRSLSTPKLDIIF
eukprot:TRINITY_DN21168_c0_g1_i1.p1 TRINITY_DN21168_c0_g1~~TRINITY_DN21168_c0_g1_i1.p1  ORF type:complete len:270 (-),score=36.40 TRINITY_DN21168_c0_g1_i1:211-948(-)